MQVNNAYSFDGVNDYIQLAGTTSGFNWGTADFSMSAWIKTTTDGRIISKTASTGWVASGKQFSILTDKVAFDAHSIGLVTGTTMGVWARR